jgi:SAM-dependent methyltransferase
MNSHTDIEALISTKEWFHSIEIADGLVTPGRTPLYYLQDMLNALQFPESFAGLSVLDIGAWDGFFSFEAEKRGAARVVAYDMHPPDYYGFALAKELLQSQVEYIQGSVYDLSPEVCGTFDVVFFFGVFYHLRYPLLALDRIWHVTKQYLLMETHCLDNRVILDDGQTRSLADIDTKLAEAALYQFYRREELYVGDYSNWFAPNRRAVADALGSAGFEPEFLAAWDDRIAFKGIKRLGVPEYLQQTYEGLKWTVNTDGSQSPLLPRRQTPDNLSVAHSVSSVEPEPADDSASPLQTSMHAFRQDESAAHQPMPSDAFATLNSQLKASEARLQLARQTLDVIERTRVYRLLRRLGRWKFMDRWRSPDAASQETMAWEPPVAPIDQPELASESPSAFDLHYAQIREPKKPQGVAYAPEAIERILHQLRQFGVRVTDYTIDLRDLAHYRAAARYREVYPNYYAFNVAEKSLEHYLAATLLQLSENDIYIDVASEHSPVPDIYHRLFKATTYRQDLAYARGMHGDRIGSDAANMPLPDGFATKMALHCSFEHFEGNTDRNFLCEAARLLKPGGAICIVPLYLFEEYAIQTDPTVALANGVRFDDGATVYCAQGWNNRFGRFYDPTQFLERIHNHNHGLDIDLYHLTNVQDVDPSCYARFAMLLTKPGARSTTSLL